MPPLGPALRSASVEETRKAISIQRIGQIGEAVEAYNLVNGHLPARLQELTPVYISPSLLHDPPRPIAGVSQTVTRVPPARSTRCSLLMVK